MSKFNINDHICMIHEDYYLKGVIKNLYPEINTAVIALDDDSRAVVNTDIVKAKITNLDLDHDYYNSDNNAPEPEEVENSNEITITKDEFVRKQSEVIGKVAGEDFELVMLLTPIMAFLTFELFDRIEND